VEEEPRWKKLLRQKLKAMETSQRQWLPGARGAVETISQELWDKTQRAISPQEVLSILRRDHADLVHRIQEHFEGDLLELVAALSHPEFRASTPGD
jgi:hypothetical protein